VRKDRIFKTVAGLGQSAELRVIKSPADAVWAAKLAEHRANAQ
jgi:hypothetical protein